MIFFRFSQKRQAIVGSELATVKFPDKAEIPAIKIFDSYFFFYFEISIESQMEVLRILRKARKKYGEGGETFE